MRVEVAALPHVLTELEHALRRGTLALSQNRLLSIKAQLAKIHPATPHFVLLSSGTQALRAIFQALRVRRIAVPVVTFWASATSALESGAEICLVGCKEDGHMDADSLRRLPRTLIDAVLYVPLGGWDSPSRLEIQELCQERGWRFILDAAHALGVPGIEQGADAIAFSFYATKVLSCGEGGAAAFPSAANAQFAECWANQGKIPEDLYSPKVVGTNARLSELAGILLDVQLPELSRILEARRAHIQWYRNQLGVPLWPTDSVAYNGYKCVVQTQVQSSGRWIDHAAAATQVLDTPIYRVPLHLMEPLVSSDRVHVVAPNSSLLCAEMWCQRHVALPCHPSLTEEHRQRVVQFLRPLLGP